MLHAVGMAPEHLDGLVGLAVAASSHAAQRQVPERDFRYLLVRKRIYVVASSGEREDWQPLEAAAQLHHKVNTWVVSPYGIPIIQGKRLVDHHATEVAQAGE